MPTGMDRSYNPCMEARRQLSAARLAMLVGFGGLMAALGFLAFLPRFAHGSAFFDAKIAVTLTLVVGGLTLSLKCGSSIENGIAANRWPEEPVTALRARLGSPLLNVLAGAFGIASICIVIAFHRHTESAFAALVLAQTVQRLQQIGKLPRNSPLPNWHGIQPMRSEHWGHR
jgi:hypothetical protein